MLWARRFDGPEARTIATAAAATAACRTHVISFSSFRLPLLCWRATGAAAKANDLAIRESHHSCGHRCAALFAGRVAFNLDLLADKLFDLPPGFLCVDSTGSRRYAPGLDPAWLFNFHDHLGVGADQLERLHNTL